MTSPRLLLLLLRSRSIRRGERGFGLILALLTALVTVISAVTLFNRTQGDLLGIALQSESRMAREAAQAGLTLVIAELNRPANRRRLVSTVPFTNWGQRVAQGDDTVLNPCLFPSAPGQVHPPPSATLRAMADPANPDVILNLPTSPRGLQRRFRLQSVRLSNSDRSRWYRSARPNVVEGSSGGVVYRESLINFNDGNNTDLIELVVQGQVIRGGQTVASATLSRDFVVAPKCCERSFGGPDQMFGNDFRWCNAGAGGFPPMVVGMANTAANRSGGVYVLTSTTPEIRQRTDPGEPAARILCRLPRESGNQSCGGTTEVNNVPVQTTTIDFPSLPKLGRSGLPCDANDSDCMASSAPNNAYSIELFNRNNGAANNSASERYAKDYLRARNGNVEICNKTYAASGATAATIGDFDRTPTIVPSSCVSLANYCSRLDRNNYSTYHCRIRNIYVNDFGATSDINIKQNNTLFIDT